MDPHDPLEFYSYSYDAFAQSVTTGADGIVVDMHFACSRRFDFAGDEVGDRIAANPINRVDPRGMYTQAEINALVYDGTPAAPRDV